MLAQLTGQPQTGEYAESNGTRTVLSTLVMPKRATYRVYDDVSERQCELFIESTRQIFLALSRLDNDPVFRGLYTLSATRSEKTFRFRTAVVASLICPFEDRIRARDDSALVADTDSILSGFTPLAVHLMRAFWARLGPADRLSVWAWIERILDNALVITEKIP